MDTHLTATYLLARKAGFTHEQARTIATGDWSMDLNSNTTALPVVDPDDPGYDTAKKKQWRPMRYAERGADYHALGDKNAVHGDLSRIREAVNEHSGEDRKALIGLGQYLHALQDVSFHQHGGEPYGAEIGHLLDGHTTDMVAAHFDAALTAYSRSYEVLKAYRDSGKVPAVPPVSELYYQDPTGLQLSREQLKQIESRDKDTGVVRIASKLALAYDKTRVVTYSKVKVGEKIVFGFPSEQKLHAATAELWKSLSPGVPAPDIPIALGKRDAGKIDTDRSPNLLVGGVSKPLELRSLDGAPALPMPGGIALSVAAAARLPIQIQFDAARIDKTGLILVGKSGKLDGFDGAMLLTVVRAACEGDDPYFSLDPDDGRLWKSEGDRAFDEAWAALRPEIKRALVHVPGSDAAVDNLVVAGPQVLSMSVREKSPALWREFLEKYPHLRSRLVFRPLWLAQTRVGEILFHADVLLKELAGGVSVKPGLALRASGVDGYVSADARRAAHRLLSNIRGEPASAEEGDAAGNRLWFDLVPEFRREQSDELPFPELYRLDLPGAAAPAVAPSSRQDTFKAALMNQVENGLRDKGLMNARVEAVAEPVEVIQDGDIFDLSAVYPHMFVRRHDHATGEDLPGKSADLDALAHDVNGRIRTYTEKHRELQALTQIFRSFVIAVKWAQSNPGVCESVHVLPLLASERLIAPLPRYHPSELFLTLAAVDAAYPADDGGVVHWSVEGGVGSINGGVSLGSKALLESKRSFRQDSTALTRSVRSELGGPGTEAALVISADSVEMVRAARKLREFTPITMDDVLGENPGTAPVKSNWSTKFRRLLAPVFGDPWIGLTVSAVLVLAGLIAFGALIETIAGVRRRLRKIRETR